MSILLKKAPKLAKHIITSFYINRDINEVLKYLCENVTWIEWENRNFSLLLMK